MGKKERKVLQDTSTGFKPYPKTSELTKKSNLSRTFYFYKFHFCSLLFLYFQRKKLLAGKVKKMSFFCLPHALSDSVPPFREWTRLMGYGVGQKLIQVNNDATSEELVGSLYKYEN